MQITGPLLSGPLCRAARALTQMSRPALAELSGVAKREIRDFESGAALDARARMALRHALEQSGAVFLDEDDDLGAGVRLRFTQPDVRQLQRLEGEGGKAGEDDV